MTETNSTPAEGMEMQPVTVKLSKLMEGIGILFAGVLTMLESLDASSAQRLLDGLNKKAKAADPGQHKTYTPDYKTHKSVKNRQNRKQYIQRNHHEKIVSRDVFNAANLMKSSRQYSSKSRPLPVLSVIDDGILRGYVPIDKGWNQGAGTRQLRTRKPRRNPRRNPRKMMCARPMIGRMNS